MIAVQQKPLKVRGSDQIILFNRDNNSEDMLRFSWIRKGPWRIFGRFSYEDFVQTGQQLIEIVERYHGPTEKQVFSFNDEGMAAYGEHILCHSEEEWEVNDVLAQRNCDLWNNYSASMYNGTARPQLTIKQPPWSPPFLMACLTADDRKSKLAFYAQAIKPEVFREMVEKFHRPGLTYHLHREQFSNGLVTELVDAL
tara:strand:- start:10202 stop:10792 length:591 start_codon:yes stop_codon:yes gene_type:complete